MQNLRLVSLAVPEILWLPKISKVGHVTRTTPLLANFSIFDLVTANPFAKFEVCPEIWKVGHVTQSTLHCDLILSFWISSLRSPVDLQISSWWDLLFWRYCCHKILSFVLENTYSGHFLAVGGDFDPVKFWYRCSITPKGMQLLQKHGFWDITRQNRSSGFTTICAKDRIKKLRPLIFHPIRVSHPWTDWHAIFGTEWCPPR